jgi:cephalosporin hydroxylase
VTRTSIKTLCGEVQAQWLASLLSKWERPRVLEIGCHHGYLTAAMVSLSNAEVFAVDHMIGGHCDIEEGGASWYSQFIDNMRATGVIASVVPFPMKSSEALDHIALMDVKFNLIYLDGDHTVDNVSEELKRCLPLVVSGGYLCGDDCTLASNCYVFHPELTFLGCWQKELTNEFDYVHPSPLQGVTRALWNVMRSQPQFHAIESPGNQFGFVNQ